MCWSGEKNTAENSPKIAEMGEPMSGSNPCEGFANQGGSNPFANPKIQNLRSRTPNPEPKKIFFLYEPVRGWVRGARQPIFIPQIKLLIKHYKWSIIIEFNKSDHSGNMQVSTHKFLCFWISNARSTLNVVWFHQAELFRLKISCTICSSVDFLSEKISLH